MQPPAEPAAQPAVRPEQEQTSGRVPGPETATRTSRVATADFHVQRHARCGRQFQASEFASAIAFHSSEAHIQAELDDQLTRTAFCGGGQGRPRTMHSFS